MIGGFYYVPIQLLPISGKMPESTRRFFISVRRRAAHRRISRALFHSSQRAAATDAL